MYKFTDVMKLAVLCGNKEISESEKEDEEIDIDDDDSSKKQSKRSKISDIRLSQREEMSPKKAE